ncbi:hypothetical protein BC941DRAFT_433370 [Chlamydoabsidia padenii]|nr:hypothetical protein BC941DRAFT_433370 [Chlamydoabsidia padenii]
MEYTLPPSFNILYLDLPVLHINDTHLQLLQQATEQSIKSQRSLIVLLRLTISRSIQNDKQWKQWQTALGALYMTQARLAYTLNEPLFDMTVMPFQSDDLPRMDLGPDTVVFSTTQGKNKKKKKGGG